MQRPLLFILLSLSTLAACDDSVDARYKGEPLLSLSGEVLTTPSYAAPTGGLEVVLAWQADNGGGDFFVLETVEVGGSFPAAFDLDVYNPPPEAALFSFEEGAPGVAIGYIMAVSMNGTFSVDAIKGIIEDHVVAYAAADVAGDSPFGTLVGGPLTAGFHLLQVIPATAEDFAEFEACHEQEDTSGCRVVLDRLTPAPFDTSLDLVLGELATLRPPDFD